MEKLKPLITHHFWILFLITLALPPVAWWMTSGDLTAAILTREEKLNKDFKDISDGSDIPNSDWVQGVQQLIGVRKEQNRLALDRLWQAQMGLMNWPANVRKFMEVCPYRGELEDQRIKEILPDLYRDDYQREVHRVWMLTEPVYESGVRPDEGVPRKVSFPYLVMPQVPERKWDQLPPTWPEIWNSQEDLWLLSELFKAVQRVNAPTTGIVDSYIKRITLVELFGGERITDDKAGDTSTTSSGEPSGPAMPGMLEGYPGGAMGTAAGRGFGAGAAGQGTSIRTLPATFDLKEEFEVAGGNAAGARGGMHPGFSSTDMMSKAGASATAKTDDADPDDSRYLANVAAYRTRGFRLQVTIHQLQVPELIRELLNSQYPIEIIRFQQMALNPDEPGAPGAASSGIPGRSMAGGVPGGPGYPGAGSATAGAGKGLGVSDEAANIEAAFDPTSFAGAEGTGTTDSAESSSVSIQTALGELDLVDLVVVGELYLYNPPIVDADGDGVPDDAAAEPTPADGGSAQPETAPQAGVPGSTPLPEVAGPGTTPGIPGTTPGVPAAIPVAPPGSIPSPPAGTATPATSPAPAVPGTVPAGIPGTTPPANTPGTTPPAGTPTVPAPAVTPPAETE